MSDIYAEFGVNNAVMTSTDNAEHEQNMLALNVDARDGDDAIHLAEEPDESTEGLDQEDQTEGDEEAQEGSDQTEDNGGAEETFELLPEAPDDLKEASAAISAYADGFTALRDQAIRNGLTEEVAARIEAEYEADGISEASYKALEKAGYSRQFVDSYIKGQESIADQFVAKVVDYAGGKDRFDKIIKHMQSTSPESTESLFEAIERQDLKAIRTIINLGVQSHTKKFGKAPARSLTKAAPAAPARRAAPAAEGYSSRAEMIRDMSKSEYRLDPAFRAKVEARVAASSF